MGCECYKIGGPFIAEDPNCEIHREGGLQDQVEDLREQVEALKANLQALRQYGICSVSDAKAMFEENKQLREENRLLREERHG
jgi:hypothetical protein